MLIECPECKKQISDMSDNCIHCGYPLSAMNLKYSCNINNIKYDFSDIKEILPQVGDKDTDVSPIYITGMINRKTLLDWKSCNELAQMIIETNSIPEKFEGIIDISKINESTSNKPKCPTCASTNIASIGAVERAGSIAMFGIFSKKINKTFKCKSCGYTW